MEENCIYCGKRIKNNGSYCCKLHEIYQNNNIKEINNLTPQEILDNILICELKGVDASKFILLLKIMLKNEDVINAFLESKLINRLYRLEIVYLFNNLSEIQAKTLSKSLMCQLTDRLISNIEGINKEDITKNEDIFESLILTLKLTT